MTIRKVLIPTLASALAFGLLFGMFGLLTFYDSPKVSAQTDVSPKASPSSDAYLRSLSLSGVVIEHDSVLSPPGFSPLIYSYTANVAHSLTETAVTATTYSDATYVIKLGGVIDADGTVSLAVGSNVITVVVTAEDGITNQTYTVTVIRAPPSSRDATLSGLTVSGIDIGTFSSNRTSYAASVYNSVSQTTVTPTVNDSGASYVIKLGGVADTDGVVALSAGSNVITVEVTAEDGQTTKTYNVTVNRAAATAPTTGELSTDAPPVNFRNDSIDHSSAVYSFSFPRNRGLFGWVIQRYEHDGENFVSSGSDMRSEHTGSIDLGGEGFKVGDSKVEPDVLYKWVLMLTDRQGSTVIATSLTVRSPALSSDATLSALTLSDVDFGTFDSGTTSYTASVANSVTQTTVTPTVNQSGATYVVKLGGVTDTDRTVDLAVGSNAITVEVTAENTTTKTYTATVTRAEPPSTEVPLSAPTGAPTISGTARVGQKLTVDTSGIADADGLTNVSYGGNWYAGEGFLRVAIRPGSDLSYTVSRRDAGTTLQIQVTFIDDAGTAHFLESANTAVVAAISPAAPESLALSQNGSGDLELSWEAPTWDLAGEIGGEQTWGDGGSPITGYVVQWKESADSWSTQADVSEATTTGRAHTVMNLADGQDYTIRVLAVNAVGRGIPSDVATATIDRPASDANLSGLTLSEVDFGTFASGTTSYTAQVAYSVSQTTVAPTVNDSGASYVIKLGGVTDSDGTVALAVGSNTITIVVTAEDTTTTNTYTVTVTRASSTTPVQKSSDATLRSLKLSGVNFGAFSSGTTSYSAQIANSVSRTTVTPTVSHSGSSYVIKLGGVRDTDGVITLSVGSNVITVQVTAEDDKATQTYTVTVTREQPATPEQLSNDTSLSALALSGIDFGTFDSTTASYTASVPNRVLQTTVSATPNHSAATYAIKLGGVTDDDGVIALSVGSNAITLEVTAEDGESTETYSVAVTREAPLSTDATLSALTLSGIDFGTFTSGTISYAAQVGNSVSQTTVTPTVSHSGASYTIELDGVAVTDGEVSLEVGENVITIEVTAEDGSTTSTYTVTVTRAEQLSLLLGGLASDDPPVNFRVTGYDDDEVSLQWEIPHNRGITSYVLERYDHDGTEFARFDWTASGSVTGGSSTSHSATDLNPDTLYRYDLALKSDSGTIIIEKSLEVRTPASGATALSSDATLSALSLSGVELDHSFVPSTSRYTGGVENEVTSTTVTATLNDSTADYTVRFGGAEDEDGVIDLAPGRNVITIHVTAEDGVTTGVYTVVVSRAKAEDALSSDASLRSLSLSGIDFGAFDSDTTTYTAQVGNDVSQTTVTPVRNDVEASHVIELGGTEDEDGVLSLAVGENVISVEVTAEDGETTRTYSVTITRAEAAASDPTPTPDPEPVDTCVQTIEADATIEGSWDDICLSEKQAPGGSGDRYARFYTFTLNEAAAVTISLSSGEDTYLYLLDGQGKDGQTLHSNDDITSGGVNLNSRLSVTLQPGDYTIEATTYEPTTAGDFTLTIEGLGEAETPAPDPEPEPEADACVESLDADGTIEGSWDDTCLSDKAALQGTGDRYARFYAFTLDEAAEMTITLESDKDTYLYLLDGHGRSGTVLYEEDDIVYGANTNSRLTENLSTGDYTIEATTYYAQTVGDFTLTISGLDSTE